jgi:carbonic anhydrase/acetyltransferase-like protein (isoleucine patch superfamily)
MMRHYTLLSVRTWQGITPTLGHNVYVDPSAVVLGDVHVGDDSSIWPHVAIRGDVNMIRIGARTSVQDNCVLHVSHAGTYNPSGNPLIIGDDVTIAHSVTLHGCTIGNQVLIGIGAIVLDGAVLEDRVMVGAGSLVPPGKRLESGFLYLGNPVKQIRQLTEKEIEKLAYSANYYVSIKNKHLEDLEKIM